MKNGNYRGVVRQGVVLLEDTPSLPDGIERLAMGQRRTNIEQKTSRLFDALLFYPITEETADVYGSLRRTMESQGLGIDENDLWIAATVLEVGAVLVTRDAVFSQVPGLAIADWT